MFDLVTHYTLTFASSSVIATAGGLLLGIHMPNSEEWRNLRVARIYLSISYFILAAFGFFSFFMQAEADNPQLLDACTLFIASYQALLFTMTLLSFIQPLYVRFKLVLNHFVIITVVGATLFVTLLPQLDFLFPFIFYSATVGYLFLLIYYIRLFKKKYKLCLKQLEVYYDEDKENRLQWVQWCFYTASGIGILALISLFTNNHFYNGFVLIYTIYYAYMVSRFHNYRVEAGFVLLAVIQKESGEETEEIPNILTDDSDPPELIPKGQALQEALAVWVAEKQYCKRDVSVDETAKLLGVDRNFLRYYFKTYMRTEFRTWRIELRIREAQRLIKENPSLSLAQVSEAAGFNDSGNFHRLFSKITGMTPINYKRNCTSI